MKNIHKIYTTKESRLHDTFNVLRLEDFYDISPCNLNVYVTKEDEDIHDGDFVITANGLLVHVTYLLSPDLVGASKVVLTSDIALNEVDVQATDDEFLEWLVKNPSCEYVDLIGLRKEVDDYEFLGYEIIIPKGEAKTYVMKGEAKTYVMKDGYLIPKEEDVEEETIEEYFLSSMKNVLQYKNDAQAIRFMEKYYEAKKEEEGVYNEEEIMNMFHSLSMHLPLHYEFLVKEQFKK
jgi:hypothetical protein